MPDDRAAESAWEASFRKGGVGEQKVGATLDAAAERHGFAVLHDLCPPGARWNIDHVTIGAAGVLVIDTKAWTGVVSIRNGGVWIGKHPHNRELDKLRGQLAAVSTALDGRGLGWMPVRGALCLANENQGCPRAKVVTLGTLSVGHPAMVARLAAADGPRDPVRIAEVQRALEQAFDVRGGGRAVGSRLQTVAPPPEQTAPDTRPRSAPVPRAKAPAPTVTHERPRATPRRAASSRPSRCRGRARRRRELVEALVALAIAAALLYGLVGAESDRGAPDDRRSKPHRVDRR